MWASGAVSGLAVTEGRGSREEGALSGDEDSAKFTLLQGLKKRGRLLAPYRDPKVDRAFATVTYL